MKALFPTATCLIAAHCKPYLSDILDSVITQTRLDIQVLVVDSGRWLGSEQESDMRRIYQAYHDHPIIEWMFTGEAPSMYQRTCMISRVTNEVIRAGLVRGQYFCTGYDDDLYYPEFMEKMIGYLETHRADAVQCGQARVRLDVEGNRTLRGYILATGNKSGPVFDCQVDGMQVMISRRILDAIGDPWYEEDVQQCHHSDGVFLNKVGVLTEVHAIPEVLCEHRFTPLATYTV
jgi:hypothetical protein